MLTFATDWWILWSHWAYEDMPNEEILIVNLLSINFTFCSIIVCKKQLHAVCIMLKDPEWLSMTMKSKGNHELLREFCFFCMFCDTFKHACFFVWAMHSNWPRSWEVTRLKVRLGFAEMMRGSGEFVIRTVAKPTLLSLAFDLDYLGDLTSWIFIGSGPLCCCYWVILI